MNQIGKVGKQWIKTRRKWIYLNPGPWECYICGQWLVDYSLTLDHVKSRSRHPELRFELSNLRPCCWQCNYKKGSKDGNITDDIEIVYD